MRRFLVILALCMAVTAASAENRLRSFSILAKKKTTTTTTTLRRQPVNSNSSAGFNYFEVFNLFNWLPQADNCGIMEQVKGYEWVFMGKSEEKNEFFPTEVTYIYYPSHLGLRRKGPYLFNNEGQLKAVILLAPYGASDFNNVVRRSEIREDLIEVLKLKAYKDGVYNVNLATVAQKRAIEKELGLRETSDDASNEDMNIVRSYCGKLYADAEEKIDRISRITRIDATTFKVQYADSNGKATIPVTVKFFSGEKPYTVEYSYDFPGRTAAEQQKAESRAETKKEDKVSHIEEQPQFPGGQAALFKWLSDNVQYPADAMKYGISGTVRVQFTVNKDGSITDAKVVMGIDPSLDREALRLVRSMPRWTPGKQDGVPVNVTYTMPIVFRVH